MINEQKISKFNSIFSHTSVESTLSDELSRIKNGYYKKVVEPCRACVDSGDIVKYNMLKSKLPAVTFTGVFNDQRKSDLLVKYSNIVVLDIDKLTNDKLEVLKSSLFKDDYILAYWVSPSGKGLKILIKVSTNQDAHKNAFGQLSHYFSEKYDVEIDKSGSDLSRLCFVSYDPDLYLNDKSTTFAVIPPQISKPSNVVTVKSLQVPTSEQKSVLFRTNGKNKAQDRNTIKKIIKFLTKKRVSITCSYEDWYRVALAIANSFSYDVGEKYFLALCRLDKERHDEEKSKNLLKYSYLNKIDDKITFGTVVYLAKKQGFVLNSIVNR